jgi:PTS system glucitol/sorbitol-specific IIA component
VQDYIANSKRKKGKKDMIYQTTVKGMGADVNAFAGEGIFVSFGNQAPETLKDFCYIVDLNPVEGEIKPGCKLVIDGEEHEIVQVGDVAQENLHNLGHVTYSFNGSGECLPGSICVEKSELPQLKVGSTIKIVE